MELEETEKIEAIKPKIEDFDVRTCEQILDNYNAWTKIKSISKNDIAGIILPKEVWGELSNTNEAIWKSPPPDLLKKAMSTTNNGTVTVLLWNFLFVPYEITYRKETGVKVTKRKTVGEIIDLAGRILINPQDPYFLEHPEIWVNPSDETLKKVTEFDQPIESVEIMGWFKTPNIIESVKLWKLMVRFYAAGIQNSTAMRAIYGWTVQDLMDYEKFKEWYISWRIKDYERRYIGKVEQNVSQFRATGLQDIPKMTSTYWE
jgi:hypothetical protein